MGGRAKEAAAASPHPRDGGPGAKDHVDLAVPLALAHVEALLDRLVAGVHEGERVHARDRAARRSPRGATRRPPRRRPSRARRRPRATPRPAAPRAPRRPPSAPRGRPPPASCGSRCARRAGTTRARRPPAASRAARSLRCFIRGCACSAAEKHASASVPGARASGTRARRRPQRRRAMPVARPTPTRKPTDRRRCPRPHARHASQSRALALVLLVAAAPDRVRRGARWRLDAGDAMQRPAWDTGGRPARPGGRWGSPPAASASASASLAAGRMAPGRRLRSGRACIDAAGAGAATRQARAGAASTGSGPLDASRRRRATPPATATATRPTPASPQRPSPARAFTAGLGSGATSDVSVNIASAVGSTQPSGRVAERMPLRIRTRPSAGGWGCSPRDPSCRDRRIAVPPRPPRRPAARSRQSAAAARRAKSAVSRSTHWPTCDGVRERQRPPRWRAP